jgi:lysozyme
VRRRRGLRLVVAAGAAIAGLGAALSALYEAGLVRVNYPDPGRFPVRGIDVSHHQGRIDWPAVRAAGIEFAFIKASEGGDHRDREFARNWQEASRAGVARGAYHFFTFCTPGPSQAENFTTLLLPDRGELPPIADVEFSGNCESWESIDRIRTELDAFLDAVAAAAGRRPMLYFTREAYLRVLEGRFDGYPTWPRSIIGPPRARFGPWHFWQFADNGRVGGIQTLVDLNVFRGDRIEFQALLEGPAPPDA